MEVFSAIYMTDATASDNCDRGPNWELFIHCCLAPSLVIVLILSFFGKRYNYRLRSLCGVKQFAVVHPINLLDDHEHRWSYALAFGATATIILEMFSGNYINLYIPNSTVEATWVKILLGAVATLELGTVLYPFFACIIAPYVLVGSLLGFMYSSVWFSVLLSVLITCPNLNGSGFPYEYLVTQVPVLLFSFLLMVRFLYYLIKSIMIRIKKTKITSEEKLMRTYQAQHVKALLRPPVQREYTEKWERMLYSWYEPTKNFIYPTRIICTFVVAVLCQYQIAIQLTYSGGEGIKYLGVKIREWYEVYTITYNVSEETANITEKSIDQYVTAANISWYMACPLSIMISLMYIGHIFVCYRKHILRMYRGNRKFLPDVKQDSAQSMTGSLQYCGFQIAYYLSGYVIMMMMFFIVLFVVSGGLVIPLINNALKWLLGFLNTVVPLLAVVMLVFASQPLLVKHVFLQPKLNPDDVDKPLALQHRDFYHNFSYFLVFLNVLVGMLSCVIRILTGLFVGVFLLCRIDRPILMRGYEGLDQSYQAYIGNLNTINAHCHPVLVVFCQLLTNKIVVRKKARLARTPTGSVGAAASYTFVEHDIGKTNTYTVVKNGSKNTSTSTLGKGITPRARAVMRWQLAYTLLFNPRLLHMRKRSRQLTFEELQDRISRLSTLLPHRQQVMQRSHLAEKVPFAAAKMDRERENMQTIESLKRELMAGGSDDEIDKSLVGDSDEILHGAVLKTTNDVRGDITAVGEGENGACNKDGDDANDKDDDKDDDDHDDGNGNEDHDAIAIDHVGLISVHEYDDVVIQLEEVEQSSTDTEGTTLTNPTIY